jgi:inorganic pyrophosphatase/exopolyphosphatase
LNSNRSIAEQVNDAMLESAQAKTEALRARKLAERVYDRVMLAITDAKNVAEREARARTHDKFIAAEDAALDAEERAILAKASADGLMVQFEAWRSKQATDRAEMQLR